MGVTLTSWVRMPVVNYLRACPLPKAKKYMSDLEKLDPKTFKRARAFWGSGGGLGQGAGGCPWRIWAPPHPRNDDIIVHITRSA